jgi:integrase/recombinase XerC
MDFNPMSRVPAAKFHKGVPRPAETGDVDAVLKQATDEYLPWFLLAAYGGLRCCEIAALDRADISRDRIYVLHGKGDKERVVPCDELVWQVLEPMPAGPVALRKDGGRATGHIVTTRAARYLDRTGFGHITMHQFRHWYASQMYEQTGDILLVQQLLGHSNVSTTQRYVQLGDRARMRAANSLPRLGRAAA